MTRANFVKKSRKAYKDSFTGEEIPAGSSYYWWAFNFGPTYISKTAPKPQQLTGSEYERTVMDIEEQIGKLDTTNVVDELESIKSQLEDLKTEQEGKLENMPEQLQESSSSGQMLQERIDELDGWISNLEDIDAEVDENSVREEIEDEMAEEIRDEFSDAELAREGPVPYPSLTETEQAEKIQERMDERREEINEKVQEKVDETLTEVVEQIQNAR